MAFVLRSSDVNFFILDLCAELTRVINFFIIIEEPILTKDKVKL